MDKFLTRPYIRTQQEQLDIAAIQELIKFERYCRDNALWDEMRQCYAAKSTVNISWYQGSGDGFVTASAKMGVYVPHRIHSELTWLNKDRAVTILGATVQMRRHIEDIECELSTDVQLIFATQKINGQWYIVRFESIYEQDRLVPAIPNADFSLDSSKLSGYRKSYACMSYCIELYGGTANQELIGIDRPETVKQLYDELSKWLQA